MAKKQVLQIKDFSGGVNSYSDPRDLKENEFQILDNAVVDEQGIIRVSGGLELKENIESSYVSVDRVTKGVKITMASGRLFKSMDDDVQTLVYPLLRQIGGIVRVSKLLNIDEDERFNVLLGALEKRGGFLNVEIRCEGHTDDLPLPKQTQFASNWDLSTSRALNIVKLLSEFSRIPESKFSAMGYGEFRPVIPISSIGKNAVDIRNARAKNRRVEIYMDAFIKKNTLTN